MAEEMQKNSFTKFANIFIIVLILKMKGKQSNLDLLVLMLVSQKRIVTKQSIDFTLSEFNYTLDQICTINQYQHKTQVGLFVPGNATSEHLIFSLPQAQHPFQK